MFRYQLNRAFIAYWEEGQEKEEEEEDEDEDDEDEEEESEEESEEEESCEDEDKEYNQELVQYNQTNVDHSFVVYQSASSTPHSPSLNKSSIGLVAPIQP